MLKVQILEIKSKVKCVNYGANSYFYIFYKRRYFALLSMTAFDLNFAMNQNDFVHSEHREERQSPVRSKSII